VTTLRDLVVDPATEAEDWQPAFQAAIAKARETRRPIYVPAENCIDWPRLECEKPCAHGHLSDTHLRGGNTTLNIKLHNYFTLDTCDIAGRAE